MATGSVLASGVKKPVLVSVVLAVFVITKSVVTEGVQVNAV